MKGYPGDYDAELAAAADFIRQNDDFLVVSHLNPDGDAISSTLAMAELLQQMGKRYVLINENAIPSKFAFLTGDQMVMAGASYSGPAFAAVISVDCADYERIGTIRSLIPPTAPLLNIDHHPTNDSFGTANLIRADAASTTEVLYDLIQQLDIRWTTHLASLIYTGLLTDTGGFRYANTTPAVMNMASEMLSLGVKGNEIADRLLEKLTLIQIRLLQKALAGLSFSDDSRIAWIHLSYADIRESQAGNEDMDGLVNYPRNVEGVEVGILFKEYAPGRFKASLRSAGLVDVAAVAQLFGGGGHVRAAGCSLEGDIQDVIHRVVGVIKTKLAAGTTADTTAGEA